MSQIDILINKLIGWDIKQQKGYPGIFGTPIAYGLPIEEQGRKTLHAHILIWIKDLSTVRNLLFSDDDDIRDKAKNEIIRYVDKVMCSSYGSLNISLDTNDMEVNECGQANDILTSVSNQKLRNMRHKDLCLEENGIIASCNATGTELTTSGIVNNALQQWYKFSKDEMNLLSHFPMIKERQDIYCMRSIYDISSKSWCENSSDQNLGTLDFTKIVGCRNTLLNLRFNEHDYFHRASCFKKGCECRFFLPMMTCPQTSIDFEIIGKKNTMVLH